MKRFLPLLLLMSVPVEARERPALPTLANRPAGSAGIDGCTRERLAERQPLPLGCASRLNLEAMLADPADLTAGAPLAPAQGDVAIRAQEELRRGTTALPPSADTGAAPQGMRP